MHNKTTSWIFLFRKYLKTYNKFLHLVNKVQSKKYENLTPEELQNFSLIYQKTYQALLLVLKQFLWDNLILVDNESMVIKYTLYFNIIENGYDFYNLHRVFSNLKENHFVIPNKYVKNKYINLFSKFNIFFEKRLEMEQKFEMDC